MKTSYQSSKLKLVSVTAVLLVVGAFSANTAFAASGFVAQFIETTIPGSATIVDPLDQANGDYGHPTEAAGAEILEHFLTLLP